MRGKTVLITGASRGLGAALAAELATRGARIVGVAREAGPLHAAMAAIREAGGEAHAVVGDVGDGDTAAAITGQAQAMAGPVDVLIHNASTLGPTPLPGLADLPPDALERVFRVNVIGPWRLTRQLVGGMVLRGHGTLVHVSSDAAVAAYPGWGAYGASKAALDHMARTWAAELAGTGVRSFAVDPGEMDTRMHADAVPDADPATLARPADVARRIADLVADAAVDGVRVVA
jgi:NAD(P)-dependent dehydrogenase (short-subunit alcohol dehydrogenase family)